VLSGAQRESVMEPKDRSTASSVAKIGALDTQMYQNRQIQMSGHPGRHAGSQMVHDRSGGVLARGTSVSRHLAFCVFVSESSAPTIMGGALSAMSRHLKFVFLILTRIPNPKLD
jgi:hypothetical protein